MSDNAAAEKLVRAAMGAGVACFTDKLKAGQINPLAPLDQAFGDFPREFLTIRPGLLADVLAALTPEDVPHLAAQVLRDAADDWRGDGRGVMFNKAKDDLTPHQRVGKWLRTRADRLDADESTDPEGGSDT